MVIRLLKFRIRKLKGCTRTAVEGEYAGESTLALMTPLSPGLSVVTAKADIGSL